MLSPKGPYRRGTSWLPLACDTFGNHFIYDVRRGRRGVSFNDHEIPGEDFEHDGAQSLLEFLARIDQLWSRT